MLADCRKGGSKLAKLKTFPITFKMELSGGCAESLMRYLFAWHILYSSLLYSAVSSISNFFLCLKIEFSKERNHVSFL